MDPSAPLRYPNRVKPYSIVYKDALPHGIVAGVALPKDGAPPTDTDLAALHPDELSVARHHKGFRLASYVGGRIAAHAAVRALDGPFTGIGVGPRGAPQPPPGIALSITHKRTMAIAIAAKAEHGVLGIDLEDIDPPREGIASRILRPEEQELISRLPEDRQWTATILRFSLKEAIYKALAPRLQRHIGFDEASVTLRTDGHAAVTLHLTEGPSPEWVNARFAWLDRAVLTTVRVEW